MNLKLYKSFETERLLIRPTGVQDAAFLQQLMNTQTWLEHIGDRKINSVAGARTYIRKTILPQLVRLGFSAYTVIRKSDGILLGICGLYDRENLEGIDLGFAFLPEYQRKGYAYEAARRIKQAAREEFGLSTIYALTREENTPSRQLLCKLGMEQGPFIQLNQEDPPTLLYHLNLEQ